MLNLFDDIHDIHKCFVNNDLSFHSFGMDLIDWRSPKSINKWLLLFSNSCDSVWIHDLILETSTDCFWLASILAILLPISLSVHRAFESVFLDHLSAIGAHEFVHSDSGLVHPRPSILILKSVYCENSWFPCALGHESYCTQYFEFYFSQRIPEHRQEIGNTINISVTGTGSSVNFISVEFHTRWC